MRSKQPKITTADVIHPTDSQTSYSPLPDNGNSFYTGHEAADSIAHIHGKTREIFLAFAVMTLPMMAFSGLLLGLVYSNRVIPSKASKTLGGMTSTQVEDAIFVNMSATALTTIASWSSTIAPFLVVYSLTLASFPIARQLILDSQDDTKNGLPTPYQFTIMIRMVSNASFSSLWQWSLYSVGWRRREKQSRPLRTMTAILSLGCFLSVLVFVTDTWLHFTTHTVPLTQYQSLDVSNTGWNASFYLSDLCGNFMPNNLTGCTARQSSTAVYLEKGEETFPLLVNNSRTAQIKPYTTGKDNYAYLGIPSSSASDKDVDFSAKTFAIKTTCRPTTKECFDGENTRKLGAYSSFNCSFQWFGSIDTNLGNTMVWQYFADAEGQNNNTRKAISNPYHFASAFSVNQGAGRKPFVDVDDGITSGLHGSTLFATFCEATVYDVFYSSVNNTITRFDATPSNVTMANIVRDTQGITLIGNPYILQESAAATLTTANSSTEVAEQFSLSYSKAALALATGSMIPTAPFEAQSRYIILVARVPILPLYFLVTSNLLMVLVGIMLTVFAFIALRTANTGEVQARLSIPGLVAAQFEKSKGEVLVKDIDYLFEEKHGAKGLRVGVEPVESGGWRLVRRNITRSKG